MSLGKHLFLGTTAALVTVAGAQAADMPVKAKPVEYVKICTGFGDGFYYIPGTDTCLKLGGFLRVQAEYNAGAGGIPIGNSSVEAPQGRFDRGSTNDVNFRTRAVVSWDVRQRTEYGPLRTYIRIGIPQTTPADAEGGVVYWDRAFLQFAGFTVGKTLSFFDVFTISGVYSYHDPRVVGDTTISNGITVWAYTADLGNGVSGTLSLEDPGGHNRAPVVDNTVPAFFGLNGVITGDSAFHAQAAGLNGFRMPDVVANLRVDQAWGYAGVSAAVHEAGGAYWLTPNNVGNGHPSDRLGWAIQGGAKINLPGGDMVGFNACYTEGAAGYCTRQSAAQVYNASSSVAVGWITDGVFGSGTEVELTRVWSALAAYEHIWSPHWKTSWFGGYLDVSYNDAAKNIINASLPAGSVCFRGPAGVVGGFAAVLPAAGNSCSPNYSYVEIGSRTQWNPVPQLDIGLEVLYTRQNTAYKGPGTYAVNLPRPALPLFDDQDVWSAFFRWQRNFYP
jgi:hypothetical protein